jgi:DnaJ-class molecular chaperone
MNSYLVLGVPHTADDANIRHAYLEAIKLATPESDPDRFKSLAEAYEKIKDEASRNSYYLFHTDASGDSPLEVFLRHIRLCARPRPLTFEAMQEFLRACSKS